MTPGLIASIEAGVVPYLLAIIQKVSPASTVIWVVFVAIVLPGTTATKKSQYAAKAKVIHEGQRILARMGVVDSRALEIMAHVFRT